MAITQPVLIKVPTQKLQFNASKHMLLATTQSNYKDKKQVTQSDSQFKLRVYYLN